MPYCPRCRDEFREHAKSCPDCHVALVKELPPEVGLSEHHPSRKREPLVHVATAPNEAIAGMWAGILADSGIRCAIDTAQLRSAMYYFPFNAQCRIHVLTSDAEKAREILDSLQQDAQETDWCSDFAPDAGNGEEDQ